MLIWSEIAQNRHTQPQRLSALVHGDLDWIVMKALEKDRARRYPSASAFADDVQRYLDNETVSACPPSRLYRFRKFARRNKIGLAIGSLLGAMLILGLVGLGVSNYLISRQEQETKAALLEADQNLQLANENREKADRHFQQAQQAVDEFLTKISEERLLETPSMQPLRKELLELALAYYQDFAEESRNDPLIVRELAAALTRVGHISEKLGSTSRAKTAYEQALEIYRQLVIEQSPQSDDRNQLAKAHSDLGFLDLTTGNLENAIDHIEQAITISSELAAEQPNNPEYLETLARSHQGLAMALGRQFSLSQAVVSIRKAIEVCEELVSIAPEDPKHQLSLATCNNSLGVALNREGNARESVIAYESAIQAYNDLLKHDPENIDVQHRLAGSHSNLGSTQFRMLNQPAEGKTSLEKAIEIHVKLVMQNPQVIVYKHQLANHYILLGHLYRVTKQPEQSIASYQQAYEIRKSLADQDPSRKHLQELAQCLALLGTGHNDLGDFEAAIRVGSEAIETAQKLVHQYPENAQYIWELAYAQYGLATAYRKTEQLDAAVEGFQHANELIAKLPKPTFIAGAGVLFAENQIEIAEILAKRGEADEAQQLLTNAIDKLQILCGPQHESTIKLSAALANFYVDREQHETALPLITDVTEFQRKLWLQNPEDFAFAEAYSNALLELVASLESLSKKTEAIAANRKLIQVLSKLCELSDGRDRQQLQVNLAGIQSNLGGALAKLSMEENKYAITEDIHEALALYEEALSLLDNVIAEDRDFPKARTFHHITTAKKSLVMAMMGDYEKAASSIEKLLQQDQEQWVQCANAFVMCADRAGNDSELDSAGQDIKKEHYESRAVFCLQKAFETQGVNSVSFLLDDSDFEGYEPLRKRPDVQELIKQIQEADSEQDPQNIPDTDHKQAINSENKQLSFA